MAGGGGASHVPQQQEEMRLRDWIQEMRHERRRLEDKLLMGDSHVRRVNRDLHRPSVGLTSHRPPGHPGGPSRLEWRRSMWSHNLISHLTLIALSTHTGHACLGDARRPREAGAGAFSAARHAGGRHGVHGGHAAQCEGARC